MHAYSAQPESDVHPSFLPQFDHVLRRAYLPDHQGLDPVAEEVLHPDLRERRGATGGILQKAAQTDRRIHRRIFREFISAFRRAAIGRVFQKTKYRPFGFSISETPFPSIPKTDTTKATRRPAGGKSETPSRKHTGKSLVFQPHPLYLRSGNLGFHIVERTCRKGVIRHGDDPINQGGTRRGVLFLP